MRKILKIARLELSILFYSPVAWLVLTIFMVQCGISFLANMQQIRTTISLGYQTRPITGDMFGGYTGLFTVVQGTLYLYIPILTMGLMSRETSSGSIKLLLSSPVQLRQIILGKFFAIIGYGLTLIAVLGIYSVIGCVFIKDADIGMVLSGLFGLYLLICTYAAIGLFMSCLTTYQVVAAISTLAIFTMLRYVGTIGQDIDFVRDLTYFLSISGRTEKMVAGLITTKDVFYYLIIIVSFLLLCVLRLKSERELKPWTVKAGRYVALVCCALLLGYLTSRQSLTGYLDATANKSLTITKKSQEITKQLNGPLTVTTYANMLAPNIWNVLPAARNNDLNKLEAYQRFLPGMETKYVYYYQKPLDTNYQEFRYNPNFKGITNTDKIAEKMATNMGVDGDLFIPPAKVNKMVDLGPEGYMLVRKLDYKGKSSYVRFYLDMDPYAGEAEFMASLKQLLVKSPKITFITGNNERLTNSKGDREYQMISALKTRRLALINQGFDIDTVDLNKQDIAANTDVLVLADPTIEFSAAEQQKLTAYINKGGNMLITGEPGRQQVLNPFLQSLGVKLKPGILIKPGKDYTPGFINAQISPNALGLDSNIDRLHKFKATVAMQGAAAVEYPASGGFDIRPLLMSSAGGFNKLLQANITVPSRTEHKTVKHAPVAPLRNNSQTGNITAGTISKQIQVQTPQGTKTMTVTMVNPSVSSSAAPSASTSASPSVASSAADPSKIKALKEKPKQKIVAAPAPAISVSGGGATATMAVASTSPMGGDPGNPFMKHSNPLNNGSIDLTTANLSFDAAEGDVKGVFPVTVALTRNIGGKQQRIIVSGDADFMSNGELSRAKRGENQYYMLGLFRWLSSGTFPVDVTRPDAKDMDLKISREQITGLMWLCKGVIPALIAIFGAIVLIRRRRK